MKVDKKELVKLVSYMVMGDGGVYISKNCKNAKFIMNMVKKNEDYVMYCKTVLENLTNCNLYEVDKGAGRQTQLRLESRTHPLLTKIRERVYTDKYKGIDPHALKLLDAEALAILYMCDGSCVKYLKEGGHYYNITLNLKRLSYGDLFIFKKALKDKLDLEWNINRQNQYYYLRLRTKDMDKFMGMVAPFMCASFKYKLLENFRVVNPEKSGGEIVRSAQ